MDGEHRCNLAESMSEDAADELPPGAVKYLPVLAAEQVAQAGFLTSGERE